METSSADGACEHGKSAANAVVDVDDAGLENLAAAEGEQLTGDFGGTRGLLHDVQSLDSMAGASWLLQRELAGEADGLGDVVEVVGDATGEASDGLHAMGVAELLFELALTGDVPDIALDVLVPGLGVGAERSGDGDAEDAAILLAKAGLEIANLPVAHKLGEVAVAFGGIDVKAGNADGAKAPQGCSRVASKSAGLACSKRGW